MKKWLFEYNTRKTIHTPHTLSIWKKLDNLSDAILSPRKRNITYPIFMHNQFRLNDDVVIEELSLP